MFDMKVHELFSSIQGESSYAGTPCFFIRFSECNLRCSYCDTEKAWARGRAMGADLLIAKAIDAGMTIIEITGGEPLLQEHFTEFARVLREQTGKTVLVETNGTCDISAIPNDVIAVMDVKCPSSGESGSFDLDNISRLRSYDEVKFVISDRSDYDWSKSFVEKHDLCGKCKAVHFSPVFGAFDAPELAKLIMHDGLHVRMQVQLHKLLDME